MSFIGYLKDYKFSLYINIIGIVFLDAFLLAEKIAIVKIGMITGIWLILYFVVKIERFFRRKHYHQKIEKLLDNLEKKYLITDIVDFTETYEDNFYTQVIRICNKAMLEAIEMERTDRIDYKEYIEQWIHEIKTPLSTIKLICTNDKSDTTYKILIELIKINNYVEQVLFYARSENVEKDYLIREVEISKIVSDVLIKNKQQLIQNNVKVSIEQCKGHVLTDEKWLEFIITQILNNCLQYSKNEQLTIDIMSEIVERGNILIIQDNGIGILQSDMHRVFEKGYTGNNGRKNKASTGLGLYLCKKLCEKLGNDISIESERGKGTSVKIFFPRGNVKEM